MQNETHFSDEEIAEIKAEAHAAVEAAKRANAKAFADTLIKQLATLGEVTSDE